VSGPRVSVCIPTFNGRPYVADALGSVLAQTFGDFELLVVDDASTDDTLDVARSFTDARLKIHRNPRRLGLPGNWNECLHRARGDYVKFLFQDDALFPHALERLLGALERFPASVLAFGRRELMVEPGAEPLGDRYLRALATFQASVGAVVSGADLVGTALEQGRDVTLNVVGEPSFTLLRREGAVQAGGFDAAFAQLADWELWLRLARSAPLVYVDESLGRFRLHRGSQSAASFRTLTVRREMLRLLARVRDLYGPALGPRARHALRRARWKARLALAVATLSGGRTT
jgi:glycosyltransferase involved in cell wall biosynthesis